MENEDYLNELWSLYLYRNDHPTLLHYLQEFTTAYQQLADTTYGDRQTNDVASDLSALQTNSSTNKSHSRELGGPILLCQFPERLLNVIQGQLMTLLHLPTGMKLEDAKFGTYLLQTLIIVSRTKSPHLQHLSSSLVGVIVMLASQVLIKIVKRNLVKQLAENFFEKFLQNSLYFIECLYDPDYLWRNRLNGNIKDPSTTNVPLLNVEVIPFFYETLQMHSNNLDVSLQQSLLHMFGSILNGSQRNALLATSTTTLETLIKYLSPFVQSDRRSTSPPSSHAHTRDQECVRLVLNVIVTMVHTLHNSGRPDQCQMNVKTVIVEYLNLLSQASAHPDAQLQMIDFIPKILNTQDKAALQMMLLQNGCLDQLKDILLNFRKKCDDDPAICDEFAIHFTNIIRCLISGSMSAKDLFSKHIGTSFLLTNFIGMCLPSKDVLLALLSMGVESTKLTYPEPINNVFIILMLFEWLPLIKQKEQQGWLSSRLTEIFTFCTTNKIIAGHCKLLKKVIAILTVNPTLHRTTVLNVIQLIETLGSYSITFRQTLAFLELLRQDSSDHQHMNEYFNVLMNSLAVMAHKEICDRKPSYFFDLREETSGITCPAIAKWGGTGFTVHVWVCLEYLPSKKNFCKRRQLYSFLNSNGVGMEGFFTADCHLVLSVSTKKNYFSVKLNEFPLSDNKWHCIQIVHQYERKMFSSNGNVLIYIDNKLKLSTSLKFPTLSSFTLCHIGSSGHRTTALPTPDTNRSFFSGSSESLDRVVVIDNGTQDEVWGQATSLLGQLGPVVILNESLKESQLSSLYNAGPDMWKSDRFTDTTLESIPLSNVVLYYEAKACYKHVCKDLSGISPPRHGRFTGHKIYTWDIKNTINCVGGVSVLMPLLEIIHKRHNTMVIPDEPNLEATRISFQRSDSVTLNQRSGVVKNPVANFMCVLTSFVASSSHQAGWHSTNAAIMVKCATASTIGALLQKMPAVTLTESLLCAIQYFATAVSAVQPEGNTLLMDIYQYLLFDFRYSFDLSGLIIAVGVQTVLKVKLTRANFFSFVDLVFIRLCLSIQPCAVHIHFDQRKEEAIPVYIRSAIFFGRHYNFLQETRERFMDSFMVKHCAAGVMPSLQQLPTSVSRELTLDDIRNIRGSLLGLIRFYVTDDITNDELTALLNFVSASKSKDMQICEVLELLKSLWVCRCEDQLRSHLSESTYANFLYCFLCLSEYSDKARIRVAEILSHIFQSQRSMEKHKHCLKQANVGFSGILWLMKDMNVSNRVSSVMLDVLKLTDMDGPVFIALASVLCKSWVEIRKSLCQHFLHLAYSKAGFLQDCAKQKTWQDVVTKLFVQETPETDSAIKPVPTSPTSPSCDVMFDPSLFGSDKNSLIVRKENEQHLIDMSQANGKEVLDETSKPSQLNGSVALSEIFVVIDPNDAIMDGDLVELAVESVFLLMWRGVTGSDSTSWKERGQVFTCLNRVASSNDLLLDLDEIKAKLLELCVEAALSDIRESSAHNFVKATGLTFSMANENSYELVRLIHDFLVTDGMHKKTLWTEKLMENFFALYEALAVWGLNNDVASFDTEWAELASIGLRLLCGCIDAERIGLVAMASAKLHNLIHSRDPSSTEEVCYLLDSLHTAVCTSIDNGSNVKEFVIPLFRDLLDKNFKRLEMNLYLSELPPVTGSSSFFDDFLVYCLSKEWTSFIKCQLLLQGHNSATPRVNVKHNLANASKRRFVNIFELRVKPNANHYRKSFRDLTSLMTAFWTDTTEQFMLAYHQREREKGETVLRFKANFEGDFFKERKKEEERQSKSLKSLRNQNVAVLRQWRAAKRFFTSERGFWKERNPSKTYWKLSNAENFSRMRLKLTENYNFDSHKDASRLRDNISLDQVEEKRQEAIVPPSAILAASEAAKEDDNVGDEDWSMLALHPSNSTAEPSAKEKTVLSKECQLITLMDVVEGKLEVTTTHVYFYDKSASSDEGTVPNNESGMDFKWSLSQLREVHLRRYNLRSSALELFLIDQTNYFINFTEPNLRLTVYKALLNVRPPNLLYYGMRTPQTLLKASNLTQKWVQREISNFDYLMQLNTIAGRTYNDLSQYPIFPWVLKDYTSDKLDLENPEVYRDFTRPMGVQNPKNEGIVRERYEQFDDPNGVVSKFHYGSHYSNAATVLFFMLRMEPFTTLHIQLQTGRFDLADRQFHSLSATFQTVMETTNDVKELIPEFFYNPEFLYNSNEFDLGKLQFSKGTVDDVILPKWAKSPADFIYQHRKALESEHVSANLHNWIDLIFGYKQRGDEAVKAFNVFYYCTYEGAVDLDAISDPIQRKAVEGMINNFGQTPTQLLTDPHPKRMTKDEAAKKILGSRLMSTLNVGDEKCPNVLEQPNQLKAFFVDVMDKSDPLIFVTVPKNQSHSFIQSGMPDAMVTMSECGVIGLHGWLPYDRVITNYFTFEKDPAVGNSKLQKSVKGLFSPGLHLSPHVFLVTHDAKFIFAAGFWDNSIRVMSIRGKPICSLVRHFDLVTCLAQDSGGTYLMSGSYDTTCIIWKIKQNGSSGDIGAQPLHILYGHQEVVTSVVINSELDVALSSSKDGTCTVHSVRKGNYVRTILPFSNNPQSYTVPSVAMSDEGKIVLYARTKKDAGEEKHFLHLYSINGKHLALDCLETRLGHMTVCGEHLVTGDVKGVLLVRELFSFNEVSRLQLCRPIACIHVTKSMTHILACLRDGKLIIVGVDRPAKSRSLFKTTT